MHAAAMTNLDTIYLYDNDPGAAAHPVLPPEWGNLQKLRLLSIGSPLAAG